MFVRASLFCLLFDDKIHIDRAHTYFSPPACLLLEGDMVMRCVS
jgi:hypothetical protein